MRLLSFLTGLAGMFMAGALAAQTPEPQAPAQPPPPPSLEAENTWHLDLSTGGRVSVQLRPDVAPAHVERIKTLTRRGFYDGLTFHRVIEGFMAQGGDPQGTGAGGSDLADLPAEIRGLPHVRGAVGMARGEALDSANSQFYIMFVPRLSMDRNYTVFGRVVSGMNFVDAIERGEPPLQPTRIVRASIGSDNVAALSAEELRTIAARQAEAQAQARAAQAQVLRGPDSGVRLVPASGAGAAGSQAEDDVSASDPAATSEAQPAATPPASDADGDSAPDAAPAPAAASDTPAEAAQQPAATDPEPAEGEAPQ